MTACAPDKSESPEMSAFDQPPPALPLTELEQFARREFGKPGQARALHSERDQNARITTGSERFVLKIANSAEDPAQIALQNAALAHLERARVTGVPRLVPTLAGHDGTTIQVDGKVCLARLVSWIDGKPMSEAPRSLGQLHSLGAFMGRLSRGLQGFGHPAAFRPDFFWSLDHVAALRTFTADIADPNRRALITALFDRYERLVLPILPQLRASVLHQDANDNNIIVNANDPGRIAGLIDFGDMCFGRTANELAITLAYALLEASDLYSAARAVIQGYVAEFPLEEAEADLLFDLMRMRLVASVCISSRQSRLRPRNDYLTISQAPAFALLERLDKIDPEFMVALFRRAAGFGATRSAAGVRAFLARIETLSLFQPDVAMSARLALLTDGTHHDMPAFSDPGFDVWFAARRPATLPESVAFYGIGPYGEKRSVYATDQFADAASPERRTRHLGVDIFARAGTLVHAPLAGQSRLCHVQRRSLGLWPCIDPGTPN